MMEYEDITHMSYFVTYREYGLIMKYSATRNSEIGRVVNELYQNEEK